MRHFAKVATGIVVAATVALANSNAMAVLMVGEAQVNLGNVLPSPIIAIAGDLLQANLASVTGEGPGNVRNGTTGTAQENSGTNPASVWGQTTTTYNLNTVINTLGYDINEVRVFSGWQDDRADQSYRLFLSFVGDVSFFQVGGDIIAGPVGNVAGSTLTRTYDTTGAAIFSGVDAIRFVQFDGPATNDGTGTVYREFDVLGSATVIPEPATASLGLLALGGLMIRRRRMA